MLVAIMQSLKDLANKLHSLILVVVVAINGEMNECLSLHTST